jgi:adenylosuccinate synthase
VTSRDTTAAAFVAEAGLSPLDVDEIALVIRAFPIRVAGGSGELPQEIQWETVTKESGSLIPLVERTSVTNRIRRVARFSPDVVRHAIVVNRPSLICLNHLDHVDANCRQHELTPAATNFVGWVEEAIGQAIDYVGVGPDHLMAKLDTVRCLGAAVAL